jgi:hypothetical protein
MMQEFIGFCRTRGLVDRNDIVQYFTILTESEAGEV